MERSTKPDDTTETDAKLQVERERTNDELLERSDALREDADEVVRRARERARTILELGRQREDRSIARSSDAAAAIAKARAQADDALRREHAAADAALGDERARRLHALLQLLATERDETDLALAMEREAFTRMLSVRDDLLAGVGHDIRGHLSVLMMNTSVITLSSTDREIIALAEAMLRSAAEINTLLADLLDAASMDAGELVIRTEPTDIVSLVRSAVDLNGPAAEARSVKLAFDASTPSVELQLDAPRVMRVLMNLLGNAIKFTPEHGRVTASVKRVERDVEVAVADTGPGIPSHEIEAIFEKFRRSDHESRKIGYGLGLHIARSIVDAHRGRIWAENTEQGATFSFRLPIDESTGQS